MYSSLHILLQRSACVSLQSKAKSMANKIWKQKITQLLVTKNIKKKKFEATFVIKRGKQVNETAPYCLEEEVAIEPISDFQCCLA